ncbi:MAG: arginine deiminase-related protein [Pseudomonadota bacterium]
MDATVEPILVHHEWGKLKEVVVGYPHFRISHHVPLNLKNWQSEQTFAFMQQWGRDFGGKALQESDPTLYRQSVEQIDAAVRLLKDRGIVVHQVKPLEPGEDQYLENLLEGSNQYYPRDPILVIGNTFIEMPMYLPSRRKERFAIRRTIADRLANSNARIVSAPEPFPQPESAKGEYGAGPFLEGGDVFVLGYDIYVGNTGNASNTAGIRWLQSCLGDHYRVHEVRMSKNFLHLDCALCTPRPGLAIVCRAAFPEGLPAFLENWQLIEVSHEDAEKKLACNGLVLDDKTILIASELPELARQLREAGQTVLTTPFSAVFWIGGSFRCWHHPLVRESQLS